MFPASLYLYIHTGAYVNWFIFAFGCGLYSGMLLTNFLWVVKIREKAVTGIRLEVRGKLYEVRPAFNGEAKP